MIALQDCQKGFLYKVFSRNLTFAVYEGNGGFVGIREKFGYRYLFTEYHNECGVPHGTVFPKEKLEEVPVEIKIGEDSEELFYWLKSKEKEYNED